MSANDFDGRYRNAKLKHLETQLASWETYCTFLDSLQRIHLIDAEFSNDREIAQIHVEIANLTKQTSDQYKRLINKYQSPPD